MSLKPFTRSLVLALALHSFSSSAHGTDHRTSLCGIQLRPAVKQLLLELDQQYEKPVECDLDPELHVKANQWARHDIFPDGNSLGRPVITLDETEGKDEEDIAHELLHLQIKARFEVRKYSMGAEGAVPFWIDNQVEFDYVTQKLLDALEHIAMYPKLRKMGFDPDKKNRDSLRKTLIRYGHPQWERLSLANRAFRYAGYTIEIKDQVLVKQLDASMKKAGWNDALQLGRQLRHSMEEANLTTLAGECDGVMKGLKILYGSKAHLRCQRQDSVLYIVTLP
jgi:hypothetical protein